ncbi:MAG: AraC-like DNA-binding protein [Cyclobacteriaceae bacterium]
MEAIFEKVDLLNERSIRAFLFNKPKFDGHWHFHPEFELTYIKKGTGIRYVGNHVTDFESGDLVLLGPHLPHCWRNLDEYKGTAQSIVIQWAPAILGNIPELNAIYKMMGKAGRGLRFNTEDNPSVGDQMFRLIDMPPINQYIGFLSLLSKLSQERNTQILAGASYAYDLSDGTEDRLSIIQNYVKDNFRSKIKLADLSSKVGMTDQSFSRFFSKTMQKPFFEFLNEYRVNIASRLLLETDKQVAEIAFNCGYESLPFFYKQFKKFKGHSPLGFRKLYADELRK